MTKTLLAAFIVLFSGLLLMAVGWFVTGKVRTGKGGCGIDPTKLKDSECGGGSCALCGKKEEDEKEEEEE